MSEHAHAIVVGLGALVAFVVVGRLRPGREDSPALAPTTPGAVEPAASSGGPADDETREDETREDETREDKTREDERGKTKQSASAKAAGPDPGTAAGA
jgi:hypothetical protein